jgi:hypothetical protein
MTYATALELDQYATARGVALSQDASVTLTIAMDYLATLEDTWQGERTDAAQLLAWPRTGVTLYGLPLGDTVIPQMLKDAQMRLAMESDAGVALMPAILVASTGSVIEETVDVISVKYAEGISNTQPIFPAVAGLLKPITRASGGGNNFLITRA